MDSSLASFLLAFAIVPLTIFATWSSSKTFREFCWWMRNLFTSDPAKCEVFKLKGIDSIPGGLLHSHNFCSCDSISHIPGGRCFDTTLKTVFNRTGNWRPMTEKKPIELGSGFFIRTDLDMLLAFVLCTIEDATFIPDFAERAPKDTFYNGNTLLELEKNDVSRIIKVHLQGRMRRKLTKKVVIRMLEGWPPFYQEQYCCPTGSTTTPFREVDAISEERYLKRGGWIIAVALSNAEPVPVYLDKISYANHVRKYAYGGVFWRSIDHVLCIIEQNIQPLFPSDANILVAIECISRGRYTETWSGIEHVLRGTQLATSPRRLLVNETDQAIRVFNQSIRLSDYESEELRKIVQPMIVPLLYYALEGVRMCIEYSKNAGRELDLLLPTDLRSDYALYIKGCSI